MSTRPKHRRTEPPPAESLPPHEARRHRRRRRLGRALVAVGACCLILAVVILAGWRWGFAPLPGSVPAAGWPPPSQAGSLEAPQAGYWFWVRELDRTSNVNRRDDILHGWSLFEWAQTGHVAVTNRAGLARFFNSDPALQTCYRGALDGDGGSAEGGVEPVPRRGREQLAHARLVRYAAWQASESERAGHTAEALEHLLAGWRLCLRSGAPGLTRPELAILAVAWRRLALESPHLGPEEGRRLLAALTEAGQTLPRLEVMFLQAIRTQYDLPDRLIHDRLSLSRIGRRFREALAAMAGETLQTIQAIGVRAMGGSRPGPEGEAGGIRRLAEPGRDLLARAQMRVARAADFAQVRDAYATRVLAALERGQEEEALVEAERLRNAFRLRSWSGRLLDRPAVWASIEEYASLRPLIDEARAARATIESCRLVLALRLERDRQGDWPDRLDALVPGWLAGIPRDPYTGKPFAYTREGQGWLVQAAHEDARAPEPAEEGILFHSAEPGEARLLRLITGQGARLTGVMDVQLLQRYGLLPKGLAGFLSQMRTNQPFAQALSAFVPGVADLRSLIRLNTAVTAEGAGTGR